MDGGEIFDKNETIFLSNDEANNIGGITEKMMIQIFFLCKVIMVNKIFNAKYSKNQFEKMIIIQKQISRSFNQIKRIHLMNTYYRKKKNTKKRGCLETTPN